MVYNCCHHCCIWSCLCSVTSIIVYNMCIYVLSALSKSYNCLFGVVLWMLQVKKRIWRKILKYAYKIFFWKHKYIFLSKLTNKKQMEILAEASYHLGVTKCNLRTVYPFFAYFSFKEYYYFFQNLADCWLRNFNIKVVTTASLVESMEWPNTVLTVLKSRLVLAENKKIHLYLCGKIV